MKHFLTLADWSTEDLEKILALAIDLKKTSKPLFPGQTLGMLFQKPSTRTRISFEVAMFQLGGHALYLAPEQLQLNRGESIPDTARVFSGYLNALMARLYEHQVLLELAEYSTIPVINGLTDRFHPCQIMADLLTIQEHKHQLSGIKVAYLGEGNNVAQSLLLGTAHFGIDLRLACPEGFQPLSSIVEQARSIAEQSGAKLLLTQDPHEAVQDTDIIYTDVWHSMGTEETSDRNQTFLPYQINQELVKHAAQDYLFMHCLPAHRGQEVMANIIDSEHSIVFHQAENRLHVQKAILATLLS